jgi:uncharacterized phiE125 gp8 family phage protein
MYRPVLVIPPATTPISLTEAKEHLDLPSGNDSKDALVTGLIEAAVSYLDGWTGILGRCLIAQTWRQDFDALSRCMRLPLFPVISITSSVYDDVADVAQTIAASNYTLLSDDLGNYVRFKDTYDFSSVHDDPPAVRITYQVGYTDAAAVPMAIKQAMLLLIRHWFDNPSAIIVGTISGVTPMAVDALLSPYRRIRF